MTTTSGTTRARPRTRRKPSTRDDMAGKRADDAITNLSAYALKLDFEYHRLEDRLRELLTGGAATTELRAAMREREELAGAREAFRHSVATLHELTRREARSDSH